MVVSQWQRLLQNEGAWVGSFTQLSPSGRVQQDTPSVVTLKLLEDGKTMHQAVKRLPPDAPPNVKILEYSSLARSILFFENGAFSQGSIQWGPFSEFGAELGLIEHNHRLRLVQLFGKDQHLSQLTLIREHLEGMEPSQRSPLTVDQLIGTWQGEAVTLYPDLRPPDTYVTQLKITHTGDTLQQALTIGNGIPPIASTGKIMGDRILFETGSQPVQVLLLPDGASSTCPTQITPRQPLFLEVGWLIKPNLRQRMIRQYTAQGSWASLTLVTESKVAT
ncbi:MAG: DUF3598 family protein [Cyanobacteria bacterium P01_H01_bin.58]